MKKTLNAICVALTVLCGGCTSKNESSSLSSSVGSAAKSRIEPVSLPDLSRMEAPVQQQMREAYASLMTRTANPGTPPAELASAYGELGNLLLAAAYAGAAEPCYLDAQNLAPNEMRWPYYLGHVYKTQGKAGRAAQSFERARQLQPDDLATLVWLGTVYLDLGRADEAEPLFAQATVLQPRSVAARFGRGRAALAKREYARAVNDLEQALSLDPRASIVHYPLALAYRGLGQIDKAEEHLRLRGQVEIGPPDPLMQALAEVLHSAVAYENRGVRAMDGGDWAAAAASFRKALELSPSNPALHHKLGTALSMTGDTQGAVAQFQDALKQSPNFAQAHYSLGVLLAAGGRFPEAIDRFSAAVKADPNYQEARLQLAEALMHTRRADAALPQYARVLEIDPRSAQARLGYALALASLGRYDAARAQLHEGLVAHPDRPEFGQVLERLEGMVPRGR